MVIIWIWLIWCVCSLNANYAKLIPHRWCPILLIFKFNYGFISLLYESYALGINFCILLLIKWKYFIINWIVTFMTNTDTIQIRCVQIPKPAVIFSPVWCFECDLFSIKIQNTVLMWNYINSRNCYIFQNWIIRLGVWLVAFDEIFRVLAKSTLTNWQT